MVIIPTEKSFDWKHTPVVLFTLVVINALVFFLYQSGDNLKLQQAFAAYQQNQLFRIEWPIYRQYLIDNGEESLAREYTAMVEESFAAEVVTALVVDFDFARFLEAQGREFITNIYYDDWYYQRKAVNAHLKSVSIFNHGLVPDELRVFSLLSHQFLHGDIMHLLGNMFFLVVCGFAVEAAIGHWRFLLFYLITGVAAGLAQVALDPQSTRPLVGASGAISGVMAMYLGVFRFRKIEFFYWFFVFVGYFRAPALLILPFYIGKEVFNYYSDTESNVAFMAHTGGFAAGALLMVGSFLLNPKLINEEYVEEDQKRDPFREKLATVYRHMGNFQFRPALKEVQALVEGYGPRFELVRLRCDLLRALGSKQIHEAVTEVLRMKESLPRHVDQQARIWRENETTHAHLGNQTLANLGMRLATQEHFPTAEEIIKELRQRKDTHDQVGILARKLALVSEILKQPSKQSAYNRLADESLRR